MESFQRSSCLFLFLSFLALGFALDMSIIDYNAKHVPLRDEAHVRTMYEAWLVKHGKAYNALGEKERRFEIFKDNLRFIDQHNMAENRSFRLGLTRFADLTNEEYRSMYLGAPMNRSARMLSASRKSARYAYRAGDELPDTVDWRAKGAVAPVKDQGQCGKFLVSILYFRFFVREFRSVFRENRSIFYERGLDRIL